MTSTENEIQEEKPILEQYNELIAELGLEIKNKFVPFSVSKNAEEKNKSINWKVTISAKNKNKIILDYSQGVGHLPYPQTILGCTNYQKKVVEEAILVAVETGIAKKIIFKDKDVKISIGNNEIPFPTLKEVLYCLVSEANVRESLVYEDWANDYGYDPDSRKGKKIYEACKKQTSDLLKVLGSESNLDKIQEIIYELDNQSVNTATKPKL